ncbi:transglycosylase family protein [Staphylococcus gallinarum]|jgi:muramidase (phage lysozyme)|uniref:transglycosylase family protein n=1 Tax=Staphylococcus gallinarum TaxID=1293 RepID=UPI001E4353A0|nr:transglycosylase family protein [Staphylococcus gallinarum]MCD8858196.1 transglycosylase family protein [Staphylococcus gallinarum]MCD8899791.1 transglycosylase family protein [Staphylococcus gallinarum]MCD8902744.1 transglycosylase family protein [Staphylococcus gallinarum]MCD8909661.1 transglycosylase family protein [Staphylococcus gallinarum]MEB6237285.1 transglycosylase family protein [Staphylococcus gallinarum]
MKKTLIASTLAVGLGVTGVAAGNSADAAEQGINKAELAQLAQSNPQQLNESPIQEGSYNYNFTQDGVNYNFKSDGENFTWSYGEGSGDSSNTSDQAAQTQQPQQEAAPQTEQTQQPQQEATTQQSSTQQETTTQQQSTNNSSSEESTGSSVNVNSHLQQIAQRESGGDLKAVNPSTGAAGKYQFLQSTWDSVAPAQYQGVSPTEAPESVQDAAAVKLYNTAGASQWVTA